MFSSGLWLLIAVHKSWEMGAHLFVRYWVGEGIARVFFLCFFMISTIQRHEITCQMIDNRLKRVFMRTNYKKNHFEETNLCKAMLLCVTCEPSCQSQLGRNKTFIFGNLQRERVDMRIMTRYNTSEYRKIHGNSGRGIAVCEGNEHWIKESGSTRLDIIEQATSGHCHQCFNTNQLF